MMMKLTAGLIAAILFAGAQNPGASVEGKVVRSGTGQALSGIEIELRTQSGRPGQVFRTTTTDDGTFLFKDVQPNRYAVEPADDAYVSQNPKPITITANQHLQGLVFTLVPFGAIAGRIKDMGDQPLATGNVQALHVTYQNGMRVLSAVKSARTDDRGEYRLFGLPPDEYYIRFMPVRLNSTLPTPTYFPGTTDVSSAAVVQLREGADTTAIDFRVPDVAGVKISGTIVSPVVDPFPQVQLTLIPRGGKSIFEYPAQSIPVFSRTNNGSLPFEIAGIPPGSYDLYAHGTVLKATPRQELEVKAEIEVSDKDQNGISLVLHPSTTITGHLTLQGAKTPILPDGRTRVLLQSSRIVQGSNFFGPPNGVVDSSGDFSFQNLLPGHYSLQLSGVDGYVAGVRQDSADVTDTGLITVGTEPVKIDLIGMQGGVNIQGHVATADGSDAQDAIVTVIPQSPQRVDPLFYRRARTDANGRYAFQGIAPGNYRLLAWNKIPDTAERNEQFMAGYLVRAVSVNARESNVKIDDLTMISR